MVSVCAAAVLGWPRRLGACSALPRGDWALDPLSSTHALLKTVALTLVRRAGRGDLKVPRRSPSATSPPATSPPSCRHFSQRWRPPRHTTTALISHPTHLSPSLSHTHTHTFSLPPHHSHSRTSLPPPHSLTPSPSSPPMLTLTLSLPRTWTPSPRTHHPPPSPSSSPSPSATRRACATSSRRPRPSSRRGARGRRRSSRPC